MNTEAVLNEAKNIVLIALLADSIEPANRNRSAVLRQMARDLKTASQQLRATTESLKAALERMRAENERVSKLLNQ